MNGYELGERYGITVIDHSLFLKCSDICKCGHHAMFHKNEGTAGICEKCGGFPVHNFTPVDARSMPFHIFTKYVRPELARLVLKEPALVELALKAGKTQ